VRHRGEGFAGGVRFEVVARIGLRRIAVVLSASTELRAQMAVALLTVARAGGRAGPQWTWAHSFATRHEPAASLRQRVEHDVSTRLARGPTHPDPVVRSSTLHRAAIRLADALDEYDRLLAEGASLTRLVTGDREVRLAEQACVDACRS
jgi:hypothetical protein